MKTNDNSTEKSSKVSLSFPPELLQWIDSEAAKDRRPRSQWIAIQLEAMLEARAAQQPPSVSLKANKRNAG